MGEICFVFRSSIFTQQTDMIGKFHFAEDGHKSTFLIRDIKMKHFIRLGKVRSTHIFGMSLGKDFRINVNGVFQSILDSNLFNNIVLFHPSLSPITKAAVLMIWVDRDGEKLFFPFKKRYQLFYKYSSEH